MSAFPAATPSMNRPHLLACEQISFAARSEFGANFTPPCSQILARSSTRRHWPSIGRKVCPAGGGDCLRDWMRSVLALLRRSHTVLGIQLPGADLNQELTRWRGWRAHWLVHTTQSAVIVIHQMSQGSTSSGLAHDYVHMQLDYAQT